MASGIVIKNVQVGGELTIAQTEKWQNVSNSNRTIQSAVDGYLVVLGTRDGTGSFYTYAKSVSGVTELSMISEQTQNYGSAAKCGGSIYRLVCNAGAVVNIYGTNTQGSTSANQNGAFLEFVLTQ